jgi:hypothetical protein
MALVDIETMKVRDVCDLLPKTLTIRSSSIPYHLTIAAAHPWVCRTHRSFSGPVCRFLSSNRMSAEKAARLRADRFFEHAFLRLSQAPTKPTQQGVVHDCKSKGVDAGAVRLASAGTA